MIGTMKKVLLCFFVATVYTAAAVPVEKEILVVDPFKNQRYIQFPDGDGNPHVVDLEDEIDVTLLQQIARDPADNLYLLFTRLNPTTPQSLVFNDAKSIKDSNFNPKDSTVVIVHGWLSNQDTDINPTIRDAYLGKGDANVIVLDWGKLAISNYITAVRGLPDVGRGLGQFLNFLSEVTGVSLESIHLVGFSLGAHLVGFAGRELDGRLARITGLDPAGPLWYINRDRLGKNDATYVEVIHTDGEISYESLGIGIDLGDADFYPNGGDSMPGCLTSICSHNRAWRYFASTVTNNHLEARRCATIINLNTNTCRGERLLMGNDDLNKSGSGRYRVNTRRFYPY